MTYSVAELPPKPTETTPRPPMVYVTRAGNWEYKHLTRALIDVLNEEELNTLGVEGWELTGIVNDGEQIHYYLKRPAA